MMVFTTGGLYWGYINLEKIEHLISGVEVSLFGHSFAQAKPAEKSAAEKSQAPGDQGEKTAAADKPGAAQNCTDLSSVSSEELSHFSKLAERKRELDLREQELNALEEELHKQREEVESRIAKLDNVRNEIGGVLKERIQVDEERVARLVEFYSNMKPKQAAEIFTDLNETLAVEVLGRMKKKNAAEIMNLLDAKKAQALSEKFAGYKRR